MKGFLLIISVLASYSSYAQIETLTKYYHSDNRGFIRHNREQYLIVDEEKIVKEINYAMNGWQVLDSIEYFYTRDSICKTKYTPEWNKKFTSIDRYVLGEKSCKSVINPEQLLPNLNDKYSLSKYYTRALENAWRTIPAKIDTFRNTVTIRYKQPFIPTILLTYGIPFDELLKSFSFTINDDMLLLKDSFDFKNYIVERHYSYNKNGRLTTVRILRKDRKADTTNVYIEEFK